METAETYYDNRDRLIYTYRGNVFARGGELYDPQNGGRGRIDCSSFVHLSLLGITYDQSPYVNGDVESFFNRPCYWYEKEPAGSAGTSGSMSIGEVFAANSEKGSDIRRAYGIAKYCREHGLEIKADPSGSFDGLLMPGDLVFFEAGRSVIKEYIYYKIWMAIAHVGIVTENTEYMINATGSSRHELNVNSEAVQHTNISEKGQPIMAARLQIND